VFELLSNETAAATDPAADAELEAHAADADLAKSDSFAFNKVATPAASLSDTVTELVFAVEESPFAKLPEVVPKVIEAGVPPAVNVTSVDTSEAPGETAEPVPAVAESAVQISTE